MIHVIVNLILAICIFIISMEATFKTNKISNTQNNLRSFALISMIMMFLIWNRVIEQSFIFIIFIYVLWGINFIQELKREGSIAEKTK